MNIGNVVVDSRLALAPMAGVTDCAFREICRSMGAGYTYTEMVSAKALHFRDKKTKTLLHIGDDEHPSAAQIFGSDVSCMAEGAAMACEISGADVIDINMGCPVGKVVKSGDGAALMKNPELAMRIIEAVKKNVSVPVTVKMRKGWDSGSINAVEFAVMSEQAGACAVAVHGRTRVQMYSGRADWDIIREVKKAVTIPVIASGDIVSAEAAVRVLKYTGADMAMIGRAAFGDPWIFARAAAALNGAPVPELPDIAQRVETAVKQFELAAQLKGEKIACLEARKHYAWYLRGIPRSGYFKEKISHIETMEDVYAITRQIKQELR